MTGLEAAAVAAITKELKKLGKRWAAGDARDRGEWRGKFTWEQIDSVRGHAVGALGGHTSLYQVDLDPEDPHRFYSFETKLEYRPSMSFISDMGSTPKAIHGLGGDLLELKPTDFPKSYPPHDDAYRTGGVWVRDPANPNSEWVFIKIERVHADILLMWGLSAEDANNITQQLVYRGVRVGAGIPWRNYREKQAAE